MSGVKTFLTEEDRQELEKMIAELASRIMGELSPEIKALKPVKGLDYWTEQDIQEIINAVILAISPVKVYKTGNITLTTEENKEYIFSDVASLDMTGAAVKCHGFITFASTTPTIKVSNFTASAGDDITEAAAGEIWEFSVFPHNGGSFIIWKNWSED